mgnify:CR=1 FL=1
MECPVCEERTRVTNSWYLKQSNARRRKHECPECLTEFITTEKFEIQELPPYIQDKISQKEIISKKEWTNEELAVLKNGLSRGLEYKQIAEKLPGRSDKSVMNQTVKQGWSKKDPEYVKYMKIAKENGIPTRLYYQRVKYRKWDPEKAATKPVEQKVIS